MLSSSYYCDDSDGALRDILSNSVGMMKDTTFKRSCADHVDRHLIHADMEGFLNLPYHFHLFHE